MLTDVQACKAKAADRPYKLTDGGGLHVCVTPAGGKLWRLRYEFNRKEKLLSIGPYLSVGVAEAREPATSAKCLRREGKDPAVEKRLRRMSTQAIGVIKALRKLTGRTPYLFPTKGTSSGQPAKMRSGICYIGRGIIIAMCRMGWRATFSTVMNERYKHDRYIIDLMLAHVPTNVVEGAYNRAEHLERRTELAQAWADLAMIDQMPNDENLKRLPTPQTETTARI
jgi:integrase